MKYFLLTCCAVLISARPEGGYRYDPPTVSPNPPNYLTCCQKLAILTRGSGGQTTARIVNGHTSGYNTGYVANALTSGQTGGYSKSGHNSGYSSSSSGSGHSTGGLTTGYTTGGGGNGYSTTGQVSGHTHSTGGYAANSLGGYTSGGAIGGHSAAGQTQSPISNALSLTQSASPSGYVTGGSSSGHLSSSSTSHQLSGSTGHQLSSSTSGISSNHLSSGLTGGVSSGHISGSSTSGLASGHLTSSGHSASNGLSASGLISSLTSSGFGSAGSSTSGNSFSGHHSSANSIRGSSGSSQGFIGGSGAGASFTPNTFNTAGSGAEGGELDGSASSGSFSSAALGGGFSGSDQSAFDAGFSGGTSVNIQKHIYVHVPPPDDEEAIMRAKYEALLTPKKHYKIIFIKAPSQPSFPTAQLLANAGQQEEKTLVYVLVKKPEEPTMGDIKAAQAAIHPSKPEVYFIKYKTREAPANLADSASLANGAFAGTDLSQYSLANHQFSSSFSGGAGLAETVSITTELPSSAYGAPVPPSSVYGTK